VGGGAAGVIVATKLQLASNGKKRILLIEAGGPTTAAIGRKAYPPWLRAGAYRSHDVRRAWRVFATRVDAVRHAVSTHRVILDVPGLRHAEDLLDILDEELEALDRTNHATLFATAPVLRAKLEWLRDELRGEFVGRTPTSRRAECRAKTKLRKR
jgi:hypothetical protein